MGFLSKLLTGEDSDKFEKVRPKNPIDRGIKYYIRCKKCKKEHYVRVRPRRWGGELGPEILCSKCGNDMDAVDFGLCPTCSTNVYFVSEDVSLTDWLKFGSEVVTNYMRGANNPLLAIKVLLSKDEAETIAGCGVCPKCGVMAYKCPKCGKWTSLPKNFNDNNSIQCPHCRIWMKHG